MCFLHARLIFNCLPNIRNFIKSYKCKHSENVESVIKRHTITRGIKVKKKNGKWRKNDKSIYIKVELFDDGTAYKE